MKRLFGRSPASDLLGYALLRHVMGERKDMITWTNISPPEILRTSYFFRSYREMPPHERMALQLARGKILDVGAGSGTHSLHLQSSGKDVTALERSAYACEAMDLQGVNKIVHGDFFLYDPGIRYDTILLLMNGAGIMGTLDRAEDFFLQLYRLLAPGGHAFIHMSDISYVYYAYDKPLPLDRYYGEVTFYIKYGQICGDPFPWLYFDPFTFGQYASRYGFVPHILTEDPAGDVLVQLHKK